MNIRTHLRILTLATLLPVMLIGVAAAYYLVDKERSTLERALVDRASALMSAIDAEMQASIAALEVLGRSPALQSDDLRAFRAEAERAVAARNGVWENIVLTDAQSYEMLINLLLPPGATLPKTQDTESLDEAIRRRAGAVGNVALGGVLRRPIFPVRVPVFRGDRPVYVIAAVVDVRRITAIAERQQIPKTWTVAVLDANQRFVVRHPAPPQGLEHASESLKAALASASAGWQRGRLADGTEIYRAVRRSQIGPWAVSIAMPGTVVDQGLRGLWILIAAFAAAAALGFWFAWWRAGRISMPIVALARAAPAIGHGQPLQLPPPGPIAELRELSRSLEQAAAAVREREESQRQAEQALRQADRAKDEFLAMLGHELRNPLASVSNAAQLLRIAREQPAVLDKVTDILGRQVEHMTRLVDDLLEVGRVTGGKVRLEREPVNLGQAVGELVATWRSGNRFLHHEVRTELEPVWVFADRARIEQVVSNLLDNALKYTPAGGRISVRAGSRGEHACLEVADSGQGMAPELMARAFDLFVQGERGLAREGGGLGIGLTMAKRLVELHGGTIRAASDGAGAGATFTVHLPRIEAPATLADVRSPAPAGAAAHTILLVEDNPDARESLAVLLGFSGHEVHGAASGREALAAARAVRPQFAVVDIGLPDLDGYEVARQLRADPQTRDIRLIALTGYGMQEDRRRALAAGFDEHLTKPVDLHALQAVFASLRLAA